MNPSASPSQQFLLVDDNETFALLLQRGFARHHLALAWARNSAEALAYETYFDGIVLDLNLDGESGLQLLPQLAQRQPQAKIVILTGYASISTAVSAIKLGAVQYLPKPADVATIVAALTEHAEPTAVAETPLPPQGPSLQRLKWEHIQFTLQQHDGNISATARALNMHRRTLQRMLHKHPVKK